MANNRINDRLKNIAEKKAKNEGKQNHAQAEMMAQMTEQKDDSPDFATIAAELEERKQAEAKGENQGYIKDTIYIEESIYKSFNALCLKRGDKKKFTNQALADFVKKKYKEIQSGKLS